MIKISLQLEHKLHKVDMGLEGSLKYDSYFDYELHEYSDHVYRIYTQITNQGMEVYDTNRKKIRR